MHPNVDLIIAYKQAHPEVNWDVSQIIMERGTDDQWVVTGHRLATKDEMHARTGCDESLTAKKKRLGIPLDEMLEEHEFAVPLRRREPRGR